jgi:hypothetical protein
MFSALPKHFVTMTEQNMHNHQQEIHCERNFQHHQSNTKYTVIHKMFQKVNTSTGTAAEI